MGVGGAPTSLARKIAAAKKEAILMLLAAIGWLTLFTTAVFIILILK